MGEWISTKDRLPEDGEEVLIYIGRQRVVAEKCKVFGFIDSMDRAALRVDMITHWIPLPEPPKETA